MKAEDVQCSPNTVKKYTEILEALFVVFRVTPYHTNIARSLLKEPKFYFYDTGMVKGDEGVRFENLVAVSLLKYVNAIEDYRGKRATLNYLRVLPRPHLSIFTKNTTLMHCRLFITCARSRWTAPSKSAGCSTFCRN